jgi:hypothetical protein
MRSRSKIGYSQRKGLESGSGTENRISCSKSGNPIMISIDTILFLRLGSDPLILDLRSIFELILYLYVAAPEVTRVMQIWHFWRAVGPIPK